MPGSRVLAVCEWGAVAACMAEFGMLFAGARMTGWEQGTWVACLLNWVLMARSRRRQLESLAVRP